MGLTMDQQGFDQDQEPNSRDANWNNQFNNIQADNDTYDQSYSWMRPVEWMRQAQPISPENFPRATAPLVFEGYMPEGVQSSIPASLSHDSYTSEIHSQEPRLNSYHNFQYRDFQSNHLAPTTLSQHYEDHFRLRREQPGSILEDNTSADDDLNRLGTNIPFPDSYNVQGRLSNNRLQTAAGQSNRASRQTERKPSKIEKRAGKKPGPRTGTRQAIDPGEEFNALHAEATAAFLEQQDHEKALELILQAISINPEINSAHIMLAEIYFAKGDNDKAIGALFSGAHASPADPTGWIGVAEACLQRSTAERTVALKQAAYCFTRLINIDADDHDARFQKAAISRELGHYAKALKDLDHLLKAMPYDSNILREVAEVCLDSGHLEKALDLYEDNLNKLRAGILSDPEVFTWAHLIVYADLVSHAEGLDKGLSVLKETARWLTGRSAETFWDDVVEDDREWDMEHFPRRVKVPQFRLNLYPAESYGASLPLELRMKLGELRLSQGNTAEALNHYEWLEPEARDEGANVYEYPDLFLEVAHALREAKEFKQALRYYTALKDVNAEFDEEGEVGFWLGIAACFYVGGATEDALQYYERVRVVDPENAEALTQLSKLYADRGRREQAMNAARKAVSIYEKALPKTDKRKYERKELREARQAAMTALKQAYKLPRGPGEKDNAPLPSFSRRAMEKAKRQEREDREAGRVASDRSREDQAAKQKKRRTQKGKTQEQKEQYIQQLYSTLCNATEEMRDGDDEARSVWIECAEALIEDFRSNKIFYPAERYKMFQGYEQAPARRRTYADATDTANAMRGGHDGEDFVLPSIETTIPDEYHGIKFSSWLDVFLEYALLLANLQYERSECYTIITAAQDCIIWYHDIDAMIQIYMCYLSCSLTLQDETTLFNVVLRWFMREFAFCTDVYRLFTALNYFYPHNPDKGGKLGQMINAKFRMPLNQKFLFRHVVAIDSSLPDSYGVDTPYGRVPEPARRERYETGYLRQNQVDPEDAVNIESRRSSASPYVFNTAASSHGLAQSQSRQEHRTFQPKEMDILLLMLYAQVLYAGGSFISALSYFYRAHSLDPKNPMILLSMAFSYMHQMFKRQNENRHMYLLQGWALFEQYADARLEWAKEMQQKDTKGMKGLLGTVKREIEFNRARCWHMLGLADLAVRGYERMMDLQNIKDEDEMDLDEFDKPGREHTMEAAYAMSIIYASNGDMETAREITEKWLVVE